MRRTVGIGALLLLLVGCDTKPMFGPDGAELISKLRSGLGYLIHAHKTYRESGFGATREHGTDADEWWNQLMHGLQRYGYTAEQATPTDIKRERHSPTIQLNKPIGPHEYIYCGGGGTLQGACYFGSSARMEVPGNYTTTTLTERPRSQPLKHEMLHYWCHRWLGTDCVDKYGKHFHPAPDGSGRNIWDLTWDRPGDALAHHQYLEVFHQGMELHGMQQYQ